MMSIPSPNSHAMKRVKSSGQAQRFLAAHDQIASLLRRPANTNATDHRRNRGQAFLTCARITGLATAA
jgi:putative transposase